MDLKGSDLSQSKNSKQCFQNRKKTKYTYVSGFHFIFWRLQIKNNKNSHYEKVIASLITIAWTFTTDSDEYSTKKFQRVIYDPFVSLLAKNWQFSMRG